MIIDVCKRNAPVSEVSQRSCIIRLNSAARVSRFCLVVLQVVWMEGLAGAQGIRDIETELLEKRNVSASFLELVRVETTILATLEVGDLGYLMTGTEVDLSVVAAWESLQRKWAVDFKEGKKDFRSQKEDWGWFRGYIEGKINVATPGPWFQALSAGELSAPPKQGLFNDEILHETTIYVDGSTYTLNAQTGISNGLICKRNESGAVVWRNTIWAIVWDEGNDLLGTTGPSNATIWIDLTTSRDKARLYLWGVNALGRGQHENQGDIFYCICFDAITGKRIFQFYLLSPAARVLIK